MVPEVDTIGVITEQGDLGMFSPLNENDQKVYNESEDRKNTEENK